MGDVRGRASDSARRVMRVYEKPGMDGRRSLLTTAVDPERLERSVAYVAAGLATPDRPAPDSCITLLVAYRRTEREEWTVLEPQEVPGVWTAGATRREDLEPDWAAAIKAGRT